MLLFAATVDLVTARSELRSAVDEVFGRLTAGQLPSDAERERVDLKEEAGRRDRGGVLLPGQVQNLLAATQLADEVACFSNTPRGGALVVGVEDSTGDLLGTALDVEWLRHRIYERIDVAPTIEERIVDGVRLLVLYVAMAAEPVEDTRGRIRWRVGSHCEPVDRAEWWQHRLEQAGYDAMAASTSRTLADVSPGAVAAAVRYLRERPDAEELSSSGPTDLLRALGVLRPDGRLTQAGALLFCPTEVTYLELTVLDVEGGDVLVAPVDLSGMSVLEQLVAVEQRLEALNTTTTIRSSFAERRIRELPQPAVREAILNALVHRDWMPPEPVTVTWVREDSALQVVSPGGFVGGVTSENVLTQRFARHPALSDLFRALRLVEKQGLGVDRMYREMVSLGHRPPVIVEDEGPRIRTRLVGGRPVLPVMELAERIEPAARRRDVRVALVVDQLLRRPFTTAARMSVVLQRTVAESAEGLETAAVCRVNGEPLLVSHKDVWVLSPAALRVVETMERTHAEKARGILAYRRPAEPADVVREWLADHDRISTTDHARLTGLTPTGALHQMDRLVDEGVLVRGTGRGRNAHYRAGPRLESNG